MQVFVPYINPFYVARCLDKRRLNKQIVECDQILKAIANPDGPWGHHPVTLMWAQYSFWLSFYKECLISYQMGRIKEALILGENCAMLYNRPKFLTKSFCAQHRRRLYTKSPELYPQFAKYGISEENWYYVNGKLVRYINGRKI